MSRDRAESFLRVSSQFRLGDLVTESSHPVTADLSDVARHDIHAALDLLFQVDGDVIAKYRELVEDGRFETIRDAVLESLASGGRIFFTGCGATGRLSILLDSIWRDFWQKQRDRGLVCNPSPENWENRTVSVMAGGDYALIKSVEGFEDITEFGKRQIEDMGVKAGDVVFAITEGGETSFVIGTAWKALEKGAKVYFVYNNPDDILREHVQRSREVIDEPRIEKINLTTGPMAITGSTRMQATTIQLCVLITVLEMVMRDLARQMGIEFIASSLDQWADAPTLQGLDSAAVPEEFLAKLEEMLATLRLERVRRRLTALVALEENVYRHHHRNNYFADELAVDVLTDTTERSPTFCVPPFRKCDDTQASESWAFLFTPAEETYQAWTRLLKRRPRAVEWAPEQVKAMVGDERAIRTNELMARISLEEIVKFRIGLDGLRCRPLDSGDSMVGVLNESEMDALVAPDGFVGRHLKMAGGSGEKTGLIFFGRPSSFERARQLLHYWVSECEEVFVPTPDTSFLLDGVTRVGVKMLLNALSTCTMVRLGRVMGNYMIYVVPSNLKLIDRATRYISHLTGLPYEDACYLLFEVIEYVEPRMKADKAYPPVVGLAVTRAKHGVGNEEAERMLAVG